MKKMDSYLESFNRPETVLVVTSYPTKNRKNFNAVAWHSDKTLSGLAKSRKVLVCVEKTGQRIVEERENNLLLVPLWEKGKLSSFYSLFQFITKFSSVQSIFVQFEFNVFGGILPNIALLVLLALLKLNGRHVTFELHQVILDVGKLQKHINITNPLIQAIVNVCLKFYYMLLGLTTDRIVVFEQELKDRLTAFIRSNKIHVLNLFTLPKRIIPITSAKKTIGISKREFTVLVFGFINGYKGIEWIIDVFRTIQQSHIRLLLVGGKNPYLKNQPFYKKFYNSIIKSVHNVPQITHVDFVPENKVSLYFSAADVVAIPYEVFMSASGPFSLALSHNKPIILSDVLSDYSKSEDFQEAISANNASVKDLFFKLDARDFIGLIKRMQKQKRTYKTLVAFSKYLGASRSGEKTLGKLDDVLFQWQLEKQNVPFFQSLLVKLVPASAT